MFFNTIKEINRLRKEINRLLIKRNVKYLLKNYQVSFWGAPTHERAPTHKNIIEF